MSNGLIVCYVTCWGCKFDDHNLEPHPWWGPDDVENAELLGRPAPSGDCTCNCLEVMALEKEWEYQAQLARWEEG
jgi:hypothetical protein